MSTLESARAAAGGAGAVGTGASRSRWIIFATVGTALFMSSLDLTIIGTALNAIHASLHAALNWTGWTVTGFTLGMTVTMPVAGRLSDQFGRKRIFVTAAILFTGASLLCGVATNIAMLIVLRLVQAVGGGAFMPSASGIVADHFGENRDRAVAMFTSILPVGGIIGPAPGGVLVSYWSWRGIFLINVSVGIAVIVVASRVIPASTPRPGQRVDAGGVAMLGAFILAAMIGVTQLGSGRTAWDAPSFLAPEAAALVLAAVLWRHLHRKDDPLIPPRLLVGRGFASMNVINLVYGCSVLGMGALVPLYAHDRFGLSSLESSLVLTARAVGTILVAGAVSFLLRRVGYRLPIAIGFTVLAIGSAMLFVPAPVFGDFWWLSVSAAISGLGMGAAMPASNNASLALAPEHVAAIVGLRGMFRQSGSILAVSVMTAVLNRSARPGDALGLGFVVFAAITLLAVPLAHTVPEHRGQW